MQSDRSGREIGPTGQLLTLEDLPPLDTVRWVARRKAELIAGIRGGLISLEDACERYQLSREELESWVASLERFGLRGLRTTRLQLYRKEATEAKRHPSAQERPYSPTD